jgi:dihydropteroate synthase
MRFTFNGFSLDFTRATTVMGILNVTPDSFSDGGLYFEKDKAIERARRMVSEGAHIIDVGGMSTRPGSNPAPLQEEIRRTVPVIEAIAPEVGVPISIDTCRSEVAGMALKAGASIVNDISGLRFDPDMASVAADAGAPVIVMHIKGTPRDMQQDPQYEALVPEILDYLRESLQIAESAGIDQVIVDPGIGFGKTFDQNLEIINRLDEFVRLGRPLLVGASRKAFLGEILDGAPQTERLEGTAAVVAASILKGAHIVRVHDVREMARVARVTDAIRAESVDASLLSPLLKA